MYTTYDVHNKLGYNEEILCVSRDDAVKRSLIGNVRLSYYGKYCM